MKKLSVIMIIVALSAFISAAVASDFQGGLRWFPNPYKYFQGKFAMTGSGSCLHSENPYGLVNNWWTAPDSGIVYAGTTVWKGTWYFDRGGTGTYSYTIYATILPGGVAPIQVKVLTPPISFAFHYEITPSGKITITPDDQTKGENQFTGNISIDNNTMTLTNANWVLANSPPFYNTICNTAFTLIRVWDIDEED